MKATQKNIYIANKLYEHILALFYNIFVVKKFIERIDSSIANKTFVKKREILNKL